MGILFALLSGTSFAFGNIMIKKGMVLNTHKDKGFFITVCTNVLLLGLTFVVTQAIQGFTFTFSWVAFTFFILAGLLTSAFGRLSLFASIHLIGPSRGSAIKNSSPIFTILFALFVLGESMKLNSIWGLSMLLAAILLQGLTFFREQQHQKKEVAAGIETETPSQKNQNEWVGYSFAILAALCFGIGLGVRKQGLMVVNDAFFGALIGALTSLTFIIIYQSLKGQLATTVKQTFSIYNPYYLAAGVMSTLGPLFFFLGASFIQVAYVSVIAATEPLLTSVFSIFLLKKTEQLTWSVWVSVLLVLAGTIVIGLNQ